MKHLLPTILIGLPSSGGALGQTTTRLGSGASAAGFAPATPDGCEFSWETELDPPFGPVSEHRYGWAVAIEGDLAAIGAPNDSESVANAGAVYVFRKVDGTWAYEDKLHSTTPTFGGNFGYAIDIDAGRIAVSAPGENTGYYGDEGALRIYERIGSAWTDRAYITQPDLTNEVTGFGVDIDLDDDVLAVGHYPGSFGAVHVYRWNAACNNPPAGGWCLEDSLQTDDGQPCGESVAIDGDVLVAGAASYVPLVEAAYVFRRLPTGWAQEQRLTSPSPHPSDQFGEEVALDGHTILVGAPSRPLPVANTGEVYAFRFDGLSWVLEQVIPNPTPTPSGNDAFGTGLALVGDTLAIGSPGDELAAVDAGAVYTYRRVAGTWVAEAPVAPSTADGCEFLGISVAFDGQTILSGAIEYSVSNPYCNVNSFTPGQAHLFSTDCPEPKVHVPGSIERASVSSAGVQGDGMSLIPQVSGDGRWVAFESDATTHVEGDENGQRDVFVRDLWNGTTELLSVTASGEQGNLSSSRPALSHDGSIAVFRSKATNFDSSGAAINEDIFRLDRATGGILRVSIGSNGEVADANCFWPRVSADGDVITFHSGSTTLVPGDSNGGWSDIFVRDLTTGETEIVSRSTAGQQGSGNSQYASLSPDGRWVVFESTAALDAADVNSSFDVYLHDRDSDVTSLVSRSTGGAAGDGNSMRGSVSADGRFVAFLSSATNLGCPHGTTDNLYLRDLATQETRCISPSPGGQDPRISACGRWVTFSSNWNLVPEDTNSKDDVYVHDLQRGTTRRLSESRLGEQGDGHSRYPGTSATASTVVFDSEATTLVPFNTNEVRDVFATSSALHPYGLAGSDSGGQAMHLTWSGQPSAGLSAPFFIDLSPVTPGLTGTFRYGFAAEQDPTGPQGSRLVAAPATALGVIADAGGSFRLDFNARIQSGADPQLVPGQRVFVQVEFVDPASGSSTYSDALEFTIEP